MKFSDLIKDEQRAPVLLIAAAVTTGGAAWCFAVLAEWAQGFFGKWIMQSPWTAAALAPLLLLAAAWLVRRFAPDAKGSGIPQVMRAIHKSDRAPGPLLERLVGMRIAGVKAASALLGLLGGASIGREGPTVQISASIFAAFSRRAGRGLSKAMRRSALVAGAAAGVSAAFNTPLAGIAFAIEELAEEGFGQAKRAVMLAVIVAGITARALGGNYLYFGHPNLSNPSAQAMVFAVLAGVMGGLAGGFFSKAITRPWGGLLPKTWWKRALLCGGVVSLFSLASSGILSGSGYAATRTFMDAPAASLPGYFFPAKFMATIISYLSGISGGIFSPCLSIGAGLGAALSPLFAGLDARACALLGMVAFFAGVVHAPLTAVIIIMEMTDQHLLILPFLAAAYIAQGASMLVMPTPLYRKLAEQQERESSD